MISKDVLFMEEKIDPQILDKLSKVCLCKGISRATIKKVIAAGAKTPDEVKKAAGAGNGACGGRRCTPKIEELLAQSGSDGVK